MQLNLAIPLLAALLLASCSNDTSQTTPTATTEFAIPELKLRATGVGSTEFNRVQANYLAVKEEIERSPMKAEPYAKMAAIFLSEARVTGRHHEYVPAAGRLLERALAIEPSNFLATVLKGSMMMTLHRFNEAHTLAERAAALNPQSAYVLGILVDANVELGHYDEAVAASDRMQSTRPDLRSYARVSYLREVNGQESGAIEAMKMAADAGMTGTEERSWALYNLANLYYGMGKLDTAEFIYKGILEERADYPFALDGLGMVRAARNDHGGAIELLVRALQLSPEHIFTEHLSDVYFAMGDKNQTALMEQKVIDAFTQHEADGWNIDREFAAYCTNHNIRSSEALKRATRDYASRPKNIDALDTYAWALYRNGRAKEAVAIIEEAMRLKTHNAILHFHAGMIYNAVGDKAKATTELKRAMAQNPWLNPVALAEAKATLLSLGNPSGR